MKFKSDIEVQAGLKDSSGSSGTAGQILSSSGTTVSWSTADPTSASGTTNYVSKFTGTTTLGNSQIFDNGTNVGIGTTSPGSKLTVNGDARLANSGKLYLWNDHSINYLDYRTWVASSSTGMTIQNSAAGGNILLIPNGNVGIGTTSPSTKLQVYNSTEGQYMEIGAGDGGGRSLVFTSSNNNGSAGALHTINAKSISGAIALATAGSERLRITSTGNVGIGTTSPDYKLEVIGDIATLTGNIILNSQDIYANKEYSGDDGQLRINRLGYLGGTTKFRNTTIFNGKNSAILSVIGSTGNVGIGTTSPGAKLEVAGGRIAVDSNFGFQLALTSATQIGRWFNSSGTNYLQGDGGRNWQIGSSTNGVNTHFDNANNRVGIGTTSPTEKLDVVGKIALNDGGNSVFIGTGAGLNDDGTDNRNVGVGYQALYSQYNW
jgi:hypothetical protein